MEGAPTMQPCLPTALHVSRDCCGPPFKRNPNAQLATVNRIQANLSFQMWVHNPSECVHISRALLFKHAFEAGSIRTALKALATGCVPQAPANPFWMWVSTLAFAGRCRHRLRRRRLRASGVQHRAGDSERVTARRAHSPAAARASAVFVHDMITGRPALLRHVVHENWYRTAPLFIAI